MPRPAEERKLKTKCFFLKSRKEAASVEFLDGARVGGWGRACPGGGGCGCPRGSAPDLGCPWEQRCGPLPISSGNFPGPWAPTFFVAPELVPLHVGPRPVHHPSFCLPPVNSSRNLCVLRPSVLLLPWTAQREPPGSSAKR